MAYTIGKTKFHSTAYGIGTFQGYDPKHGQAVLCIEFPNRGIIKFAATAVKDGHLHLVQDTSTQATTATKPINTPVNTAQPQKPVEKKIKSISDCIFAELTEEPNVQPPAPADLVRPGDNVTQYDSAPSTIGDKNVLESFDCEDIVFFNESYVIVGNETRAQKIRAAYDLTVIGSLDVDEIHVLGTLTVMGNIKANKLVCYNNLLCQGDIWADYIYIGQDIVADSVKCIDFSCVGNAVIRTTFECDKSSRTGHTMIACEGIIGAGVFVAVNAIANEYFEFDGDSFGRIVELETETVLSDIKLTVTPVQTQAVSDISSNSGNQSLSHMSIEQSLKMLAERLSEEYSRLNTYGKETLLKLTNDISTSAICELNNVDTLFRYLLELPCDKEIDDIGDYLLIAYAKKKLPEQLYHHKCVEHIDSKLLPAAEENLENLEFTPFTVRRLVQSLFIIVQLEDTLPISAEVLYDKVFSSVGLRFATVRNIISRVGKQTISATTPAAPPVTTASHTTIAPSSSNQVKQDIPNKPVNESAVHIMGLKFKNRAEFLETLLLYVGRPFGMTLDEQSRLRSVKIRTVGEFVDVDEAFIRNLYKKKPFLADHLIGILKKMQTASNKFEN